MKTPFCFYGHTKEEKTKAFLSNFYPAPSVIEIRGSIYGTRTSEHAFMLCKAAVFKDGETFDKILDAESPAEAKALGRLIKNYDDSVWDMYKVQAMMAALRGKLSSCSLEMYTNLVELSKSHYFVEASPYDKIWGTGVNEELYLNATPEERKQFGQNLLGRCWDAVLGEHNESVHWPS